MVLFCYDFLRTKLITFGIETFQMRQHLYNLFCPSVSQSVSQSGILVQFLVSHISHISLISDFSHIFLYSHISHISYFYYISNISHISYISFHNSVILNSHYANKPPCPSPSDSPNQNYLLLQNTYILYLSEKLSSTNNYYVI